MNEFLHRPVSAYPLAFFRIVWGLFLLYYYLTSYWIFNLYFGELAFFYTPGLTHTPPTWQWSLFYWMDASPALFHAVYAVALTAAVGMVLGWRTRSCAVLTFACAISLITPVPWGTNSADQLVKILSFLFLAVSLCGFTQRAYSLDARRADGERPSIPEPIPVWSYRLFQVQLCVVYFSSGLAKAGKVDWQNGQAMGIVFRQTDSWMRLDLGLAEYPALTALLTTSTLLFELALFPLLVWFRATRLWILVAGVAFHLFIVATMKVFIFTEVMILFYFAFLKEHEVRTCITCVQSLFRRPTAPTPERAS